MAKATKMGRRERVFAAIFSVVTIAAVAAPMLYWKDDFPLSDYPMFSRPKKRVSQIYHVVGFSSAGNHRPMPPRVVGTDEIMQAYQTVKLAIRRGRPEALDLCRKAARYVAAHEEFADIELIDVRIDWFDSIAYWAGDRAPRNTRSIARCDVEREPAS